MVLQYCAAARINSSCDTLSLSSSPALTLIENGLDIDVLISLMICNVAFLSRIMPLHHPHDITLGDGQPMLSSIPKNDGYFCSISIAVLMSVSGFQP